MSPNVIAGGYRSNVIPSEATATLDVRMLPDEDPDKFLAEMKKVVNDTTVEVRFQGANFGRPTGVDSKIDSEAFKAIDGAPVDLVFLLLSPPDAGADHLKALAAISRVTRHAPTLEKMRGARSRDALAAVLLGADERDAA